MSSIGDALLDSLRSVERPGDFCTGDTREIVMPTIDVDGIGRIAFPILTPQAEHLVAAADAAPYGRGEATVIDREVRRTWQLDPTKVRISGRRWDETLARLVVDAVRGLGVEGPVEADFYKLLVYDTRGFFVDHRDTEKAPGMFATMVLVLPSDHRGGELVVKHLGREVVFDLRPQEPSEIGLAAFYADCVHEVRPVQAGHRLTLVYNLCFAGKSRRVSAPDYRKERERVVQALRSWASDPDAPDKLVLPLEHVYTPAELSFRALKGADAGVASVLVGAAAEADCDLHLALASIEESGSAEDTGYYGRGRWDRDEDEEDEEDEGDDFEVVEVIDRDLILSEWRRPDGGEASFGLFPFGEDELCPPDAFEKLTPDEQHFHEATGNEGASFDRTYRRAGFVLWPTARRFAVLNQAGLPTTLPHLEGLTARWEANGRPAESPSWREADELSGHMVASWSRLTWRSDDDVDAERMLELQVRLGNMKRIDEFLSGVSAEGNYAARDNEAIMRAVALLPALRATELLVGIVARNAPLRLSACGDLVKRCVEVTALGLEQIGAALVKALPGPPAKQRERDPWDDRPKSIKPGFVVDLLIAT
ncbi:MAG: 2OG-Fe(II) oxygenase, partial [Bradyrhizobium sp.]|uniref:2OG-Fe(II) oxygenase n=1 Tax=Bradyrhizobium sp. TaxID=376 RepID=UPI001D74F83F